MRNVKLLVGNRPIGEYPTWAYDKGQALGIFAMPTYELIATGQTSGSGSVKKTFEVFRFGVQCKDGVTARVVGLAALQTHVLKGWNPTYSVHSDPTRTSEDGAWRVYDNFLIHDGPDSKMQVLASIGCVELVGPKAFSLFNDLLIELSGPPAGSRAWRLAQIGKAKNISITYQAAARPPLKAWS